MNPLDIVGIVYVSLLLYSFIFANILINNKLKSQNTIHISRILIIGFIVLLISINIIVFMFFKSIYIALIITIDLTITLSVLKYYLHDLYNLHYDDILTIVLEIIQNIVFIGLGIYLFITLQASFNNILLTLFICLGFIILSWISWLITFKCLSYDVVKFDEKFTLKNFLIPLIASGLSLLTFIVSLFFFWSELWMGLILLGIGVYALLHFIIWAFSSYFTAVN